MLQLEKIQDALAVADLIRMVVPYCEALRSIVSVLVNLGKVDEAKKIAEKIELDSYRRDALQAIKSNKTKKDGCSIC